jgi:hypothetical protein
VLIRGSSSLTFFMAIRIRITALGLVEPLQNSSSPHANRASDANVAEFWEIGKSARQYLGQVRSRIAEQPGDAFQIEDFVLVCAMQPFSWCCRTLGTFRLLPTGYSIRSRYRSISPTHMVPPQIFFVRPVPHAFAGNRLAIDAAARSVGGSLFRVAP